MRAAHRDGWESITYRSRGGEVTRKVKSFLATCDEEKSELTDRSSRPWDNPDRSPSHADRRRSIAKKMLEKQFLNCLPKSPDSHKFRQLVADLISLSA